MSVDSRDSDLRSACLGEELMKNRMKDIKKVHVANIRGVVDAWGQLVFIKWKEFGFCFADVSDELMNVGMKKIRKVEMAKLRGIVDAEGHRGLHRSVCIRRILVCTLCQCLQRNCWTSG